MLKTIVPVCALALVIHSTLVYGQGTSAIAGQNPASSTQGIITTVVGTDFAYPNQALPALNAPLGAAVAVALDPAGNLYVADSSNSIVLKMDAAGILTVVAGNRKPGFSGDGGPATNAALNLPSGIALDSSSNLFIADSGNNRIRKVTPSGVITTIAGNGNSGFSGDGAAATQAALSHPGAVAVDNAGNVFVADNRNGRIRKITATGNITTVAGNGAISSTTSTVPAPGDGGPATQAPVYFPTGIAVDQNGALWIAGDFVLRQVSPSGVISSIALPIGTCTSISTELALDGAGDVFVSNAPCGYVFKMKPGGAFTLIAGNAPENLSKAFSGDGGPALTAGLNEPMGLALDAAGNLYIADSGNGRIRQINSSAIINTVAGNGSYRFGGDGAPPLSAYLSSPVGVAVGKDGNLYIADTANNRIRKVAGGRISTVAGSGGRGFSGDGGPATSASLNLPLGVAADEAGNVYIADATNSRLRKATRDGIINTILGGGGSVALDSSDDVFTTDAATVYELTADGKSLVVARNNPQSSNPGDGGPATATRLFFVISVAVDAAGNVFIADRSGQRVRKVTTDGVIHTVAGNGTAGFSGDGGPATAASLNTPYGIALDAVGDLYIADQGNHRVRVVTPDGIINTLVGTGVPALSGDGGPPGSATLNGPSGLAVDPAGNLYIGDTGNNRIREVLIAAASYQATPADLSFSGAAGGSAPGGQIINLASDAGLAFTASSNAPWLGVNPASGAMPATLQVTADPSTLSAGTYKGIITLTVPYAVPATAAIAVTFTVSPATPAILSADTQNVTLSATQGGSAVAQQLRITCTGSGPLDFTASTTVSSPAGGSWLSVSATSGTVTPSSAALLTVIASPGTLASGTYSGTVTIAGGGKNLAIPVTMSVSPPTATILLSQSALSFTAVAQGGVPLPQNFGILNIGQGSMSWVASASTLSGGGWLHISPLNGTVNRPYLDVSLVDVSIDPGTLG